MIAGSGVLCAPGGVRGRCQAAVKFGGRHFDGVVAPLCSVTSPIRKVIYTTDAVESLNSSLRTVVQRGTYSSGSAILTRMAGTVREGASADRSHQLIRNLPKIRK